MPAVARRAASASQREEGMWIGGIRLVVATKNAPHAGTDSPVRALLLRDDEALISLRLDHPGINDLERGTRNEFIFTSRLPRINDQTPTLPPSVLQFPMPYPDSGFEFSHGMKGHLKF